MIGNSGGRDPTTSENGKKSPREDQPVVKKGGARNESMMGEDQLATWAA